MRDFRLRISNISGALSGIQIDVNVNIIFENMNYRIYPTGKQLT